MKKAPVGSFQAEDKVFRLSQSERNAGRFGDLAAVGVVTYVKRRERAGVPRNARSGFWGFADEKQ